MGGVTTFSEALAAAMQRSGYNITRTAAAIHRNTQTVGNALRGVNVPRLETVAALADVLHAPELLAYSERDRTRQCVVCNQGFVTRHTRKSVQRYCSAKCSNVYWTRRHTSKRRNSVRREIHLLSEYQDAVAAFCRSCTQGEPACRDNTCELRPVSPLPFIAIHRRAA